MSVHQDHKMVLVVSVSYTVHALQSQSRQVTVRRQRGAVDSEVRACCVLSAGKFSSAACMQDHAFSRLVAEARQ